MPQKTDNTEPVTLLTAHELAAKLRLPSVRALWTAHHRGHVPKGTRIPGLGLRWDARAIDQWLAERLAKGAA